MLPIDNLLFFSILLLNFFVRNFYISLCHALMRMIVSTTPRGLHGNGCHTEWRIKRTVLYTFSPCSSFWLTAFLTITLLYDRHPSLLLLILISNLTLCDLFFFSHHFCTESLYGDTTDKPLLDCCACGTAKYRVTFYGNWSEKIHPKDYPRKHNFSVLHVISCLMHTA